MSAYNIYLTKLGDTGMSEQTQSRIQTKLQAWFNQIVAGTGFSGAMVHWVGSEPSIQDYELLAYFLPTAAESVVVSMPGYALGAGSKVGVTARGSNARATEIYAQGHNAGLEQLTFHELMHNKLDLFGNSLHVKDGLAISNVLPGTSPSEANIGDMRAALSNTQPQWLGGWTAFNNANGN